jgi:hypothetical protein
VATKTRRGKPSVVRAYAPDRTVQEAALKVLMERTPAKPGPTPTDKRQGNNR